MAKQKFSRFHYLMAGSDDIDFKINTLRTYVALSTAFVSFHQQIWLPRI